MDMMQAIAIRRANSMKLFSDGDETFCYGDWKAWEAACLSEGKTIPPAEFKALPKEKMREYLARHNAKGQRSTARRASAEPTGYASGD